jgi:hypothetical protein
VVEHSLGKGEVDSSILSSSTSKPAELCGFQPTRQHAMWQINAEHGSNRQTVLAQS